jgi:dipeptide/tripeptide permease
VGLSEDTSTAIVHFYYFAAYIFGIPGAIIADNWLGRYKTLLFGMSFLGGIGNVVMVIGTIEYFHFLLRFVGFFWVLLPKFIFFHSFPVPSPWSG